MCQHSITHRSVNWHRLSVVYSFSPVTLQTGFVLVFNGGSLMSATQPSRDQHWCWHHAGLQYPFPWPMIPCQYYRFEEY